MKKVLFFAAMMFITSTAFAGDSDQLKAILKATTYDEAAKLVTTNLDQLASPAEKAKAYNKLVDLALDVHNKQQDIINKNAAAKLQKTAEEPYDTVAYFNSAYDALTAALECDKYDQMPDAKGKVKPKFHDINSQRVAMARLQLVTAGNEYAGKGDAKGVLKYWGTFLDTEDAPLLSAVNKSNESQFLGQVAYYAAQYAAQQEQYDRAEKYINIALKDSSVAQDALNFKYMIAQRNLKTHEDSVKYVTSLSELYKKDPKNDKIFGTLSNMYSLLNMKAELNNLISDKIKNDPNDATAWALKGQTEMNNQKWDDAIESFKKSVAIKDDNPLILTYLGFCMNSKAGTIEGNIPQQKALYKESMGYLEKAKQLDPNKEKANWTYPLYQCYYINYSANDPRTKALEAELKQKK